MAWKPETVERKTAEFIESAKQFQGLKTVDLVTAYTEAQTP
jgi:hypothetical protein